MKKLEAFDLSFRPDGYWSYENPIGAILSDVKGEQRRRLARDLLEAGDEVPESLLESMLDNADRDRVGKVHPLCMGGEYLPPDADGETQIARIAMMSTTGDVIEIRARPVEGGYAYRVVDEYDFEYEQPFEYSERALTLAELVSLIDDTVGMANHMGTGLVFPVMRMNWSSGWMPPYTAERYLAEARRFMTVTSELYPELQEYYEVRINDWIHDQEWFVETLAQSLAEKEARKRAEAALRARPPAAEADELVERRDGPTEEEDAWLDPDVAEVAENLGPQDVIVTIRSGWIFRIDPERITELLLESGWECDVCRVGRAVIAESVALPRDGVRPLETELARAIEVQLGEVG